MIQYFNLFYLELWVDYFIVDVFFEEYLTGVEEQKLVKKYLTNSFAETFINVYLWVFYIFKNGVVLKEKKIKPL